MADGLGLLGGGRSMLSTSRFLQPPEEPEGTFMSLISTINRPLWGMGSLLSGVVDEFWNDREGALGDDDWIGLPGRRLAVCQEDDESRPVVLFEQREGDRKRLVDVRAARRVEVRRPGDGASDCTWGYRLESGLVRLNVVREPSRDR